jgi:hypothetical protein
MRPIIRSLLISLIILWPTTAVAQASAFAQVRHSNALRGLREVTVFVNVDAPADMGDTLTEIVADSVMAQLAAAGLSARRGSRTGAVAVYPALFVELVVVEAAVDSLRVMASIILVEATQSVRSRTYSPSITWAARNRPRLPKDHFYIEATEALTGVFIRDWRCASGQLGLCPGGRTP